MNSIRLAAFAVSRFALSLGVASATRVAGQDHKTSYPGMAPLDRYLMDRNAETALARPAAPGSLSPDFDVFIVPVGRWSDGAPAPVI